MHPTLGSLAWARARTPFLRAQLIAALLLFMALLAALPSCAWFGHRTPPGASAGRTVPALLDAEPIIRVRLATQTPTIAIEAGSTVWIGREGGLTPAMRAATPVLISRDAKGWWVLDNDGEATLLPFGTGPAFAAEIRRTDDRPLGIRTGASDDVSSWEIAGQLVLSTKDPAATTFDVVEHVGTEVYLAGVLAAELPWDWSMEALKAQAVAARSYALHERQRRLGSGLHYDVESDTRSQAYSGLRTHPRAVDAVKETGGLVLMEGSSLVRAYYSSTCGGRQQQARNIWPIRGEWAVNLAPAINAGVECRDCAASPKHRWTVIRTRTELAQSLRRYGQKNGFSVAQLTGIRSIEATAHAPNGRPTVFTIVDQANKSHTLSAEHLRQATNDGMSAEQLRRNRVASSDLEVSIDGDRVTITGRGFGHGVGLCQYGAQGKASRGLGWQRILRDYYPTARVVPFYGKTVVAPIADQ